MNILVLRPNRRGIPEILLCKILMFLWSFRVLRISGRRRIICASNCIYTCNMSRGQNSHGRNREGSHKIACKAVTRSVGHGSHAWTQKYVPWTLVQGFGPLLCILLGIQAGRNPLVRNEVGLTIRFSSLGRISVWQRGQGFRKALRAYCSNITCHFT